MNRRIQYLTPNFWVHHKISLSYAINTKKQSGAQTPKVFSNFLFSAQCFRVTQHHRPQCICVTCKCDRQPDVTATLQISHVGEYQTSLLYTRKQFTRYATTSRATAAQITSLNFSAAINNFRLRVNQSDRLFTIRSSETHPEHTFAIV